MADTAPRPSVLDEPPDSGGPPQRSMRIRNAYLATSLALIAIYPAVPTAAQLTIRLAASLATIPAVLVGLRRTSRDRWGFWIWLLAALTLINLANFARILPGAPASVADRVLDAAGNLLLLLAALHLIRQQRRVNLGSIIDTSIVALALSALLWHLVLQPNLIPSSQTGLAKVALFIVVFALSGVSGALAQMIIQRHLHALWPLAIALALTLIADIVAGRHHQPSTDHDRPHDDHRCVHGPRVVRPRPDRRAAGHAGACASGPLLARSTCVPRPGRRRPSDDHRRRDARQRRSRRPRAPRIQRPDRRPGHAAYQQPQHAARPRRGSASIRGQHTIPSTGLVNRREFTTRSARNSPAATAARSSSATSTASRASMTATATHRGDHVLTEVAQRLRSCVRSDDLVGRLGGDEFVILLRNTTPDEVHDVERRIATALAQPIIISNQPTRIGVTTGSAFAAHDDTDADELVERADKAMYLARANQAGRRPRNPAGP